MGTLADFVEVSGEHEGVVDEFLREELNYVVVESWGAAEEGVRVLKTSDGRATFLVHSDAQGVLFDTGEGPVNEPGLTPLRDAIKVLNGFGRSLESLLPKLRHGYLAENAIDAQRLALRYTHAYFLTPEGECFHRSTVTGGKPASEGPLALKRELRETEGRLAKLESELAGRREGSRSADARDRGAHGATGDARRRAAAGRERGGQPGRGAEADGGRGAAHRAAHAGVGGAGGAQQGRARGQAAVDRGKARRSRAA